MQSVLSPLETRPTNSAAQENEPPKKRQKVTRACDACKTKKKRCSGDQPCATCREHSLECLYLSSYTRGRPQEPPPATTEAALGTSNVTSTTSFATPQYNVRSPGISTPSLEGFPSLFPVGTRRPDVHLPYIDPGAAHYTDRDVGHTRTPSSIHESPRPSTSQHAFIGPSIPHRISLVPDEPASRDSSDIIGTTNAAGQYLGPASAHSFLQGAWKRLEQEHAEANSQQEDVGQGPNGSSIFSFGDRDIPRPEAPFHLPPQSITNILLARFFDFAQPTYRFLHRPTVAALLKMYHEDPTHVATACQAVILFVLAVAATWAVDESGKETFDGDLDSFKESDTYFNAAWEKLASEKGPPTLESVQARMTGVLYLLNTSRPNQAWFLFGTTVQLATSLGLHRRRTLNNTKSDFIVQECRRRLLWNCYTLDTYLSVMFGRPRLLRDEDIDQDFPHQINDEDMTAEGIKPVLGRKDCLLKAPIFHAKLARIVSQASREQYSIHDVPDKERRSIAALWNNEIAAWQDELPPFLSGAIHASSLIPVLWRQMTVLRLAHSHAIMLVNRPFLLYKTEQQTVRHLVTKCLLAAKEVVDLIIGFMQDGLGFPFWYTQYITFNAVTIIYVYIIQRKRGRVSMVDTCSEESLFTLVEAIRQHFAKATRLNAPRLRYSIILDELRQQTQHFINSSRQHTPSDELALANVGNEADFLSDTISFDFAFDEFWPQLDSMPLFQFE